MATTISPRDIERTNRWLTRSRRFGYVPPEPFTLLALRLAARNRVRWLCSPLIVLTAALLVWGWHADSAQLGHSDWRQEQTGWVFAAYAVAALFGVVLIELGGRADVRIGRLLPHRVSRGTAVPVWAMLGWARTAYVVTAILSESAFVVFLLVWYPGGAAWAALAAWAGAGAFVAVGIWRATTRATVATDAVSLAIDEMLRSEESFAALTPLYALAMLLAFTSEGSSSSVAFGWTVANLALVVFWLLVLNARPWPTLPEPPPDPLAGPYASPPPVGAVQ
jgi:hypothetical protein